MAREIHLSSLVVHARPDRLDEVTREILSLGCEVHHVGGTGKLVVTIETDDGGRLGDTVTALQRLDHVHAATLVFHHCEPEERPAAPATEREARENRP